MKGGKGFNWDPVCASLLCDSVLSLKEGGITGFYRGLTPTIIGMAPYAGYFLVYLMWNVQYNMQNCKTFLLQLTSSCHCFLYIPGFSFFTFGTLKTLGLTHFPELLGKPSLDNPDVLVLKTHVNLLCGGVAGAIAQTISYGYFFKSLLFVVVFFTTIFYILRMVKDQNIYTFVLLYIHSTFCVVHSV